MNIRVIAVDWSGAKEPLKNLWLAEADPTGLIDVRRFQTRASLIAHLIEERKRSGALVVGLDFAFSLPAWFLERNDLSSAGRLWSHMEREADRWLRPTAPFWERAGAGRPSVDREFRQTDLDLREDGVRPTSPFKLVGASQVGRGSLRGMEHLAKLRKAGFKIWPFQAGLPLIVEIYPAGLAGRVKKGDPEQIARAVSADRRIPSRWKAHAACSQDAFDAAMSALRMAACAAEFADLQAATRSSRYRLEGAIWMPGTTGPGRAANRAARRSPG